MEEGGKSVKREEILPPRNQGVARGGRDGLQLMEKKRLGRVGTEKRGG